MRFNVSPHSPMLIMHCLTRYRHYMEATDVPPAAFHCRASRWTWVSRANSYSQATSVYIKFNAQIMGETRKMWAVSNGKKSHLKPQHLPHRSRVHTDTLVNLKNASGVYLYLNYTIVIIKIPCGFPYFDVEASLKPFMWGPTSKLHYGFEFLSPPPTPAFSFFSDKFCWCFYYPSHTKITIPFQFIDVT